MSTADIAPVGTIVHSASPNDLAAMMRKAQWLAADGFR
jgi:hypothetical protein